MTKVEFIESYIKVGNDYQWHDNHGELIRCKDCKHYRYVLGYIDGLCGRAEWYKRYQREDDYCSRAERKEE